MQALSMGREVRICLATAAPKGRAGNSEWTARKQIAVSVVQDRNQSVNNEDLNVCQRD